MQKVIAANVRALLSAGKNGLRTQQAVAKAATAAGFAIDQKTVSRVIHGKHALQIDTIQALAAAFDIEPYQLMIPGLDPKDPQVLRQLTAAESRLYKALEEVRAADQNRGNS